MKFPFLCFLILLPLISMSAVDVELTAFSDIYMSVEPSSDFELLRNQYFLHPRFSGYLDSLGLEWHISGNFYYQLIDSPSVIPLLDIVDEAYLFLPIGNLDISLGQKYLSFGFADVFSSLNCVNGAHRVLYNLDAPYLNKQPDLMLHISYYPNFEDSFDFAYIPIPRADTDRSDPVIIQDSTTNIIAEIKDSGYLLNSMHSFFLSYSRYMSLFDLQLLYAYYTDQTPDFDLDSLVLSGSQWNGTISNQYNRKQTLGAGLSTTIGNWALSQEVGLNITQNWNGDLEGIQYSDITSNTQIQTNLPGNILSQVMIIYQHLLNKDKSAYQSSTLQSEIENFHQQPVQNILFFVTHFEKNFFREKLITSLNMAYYFSPAVYIAPKAGFQVTDNFMIETGADITMGPPPENNLRRNPINDNLYFRLKYQF